MRIGKAHFGLRLALGLAVIAPTAASTISTPDNAERGLQGETLPGEAKILATPYSKGVHLIGRNSVRPVPHNLNMSWSGHCAYVASGMTFSEAGGIQAQPHTATSGLAVIDVSNPSAPRLVTYLQDRGSIDATETTHAVTRNGRSILAASNYGGVEGMSAPKEGWLAIHDVTDCAKPRLLSETQWPEPVHTLTVSPSARYVYGTVLNPFTGKGGIEIMDISNPSKPKYLGKFEATRKDGTAFEFAPHELVFSPDEKRIYVGVTSSRGGDLVPDVAKGSPGKPDFTAVGEDAGGVYIFDNSDFAMGKADPKLRLVGTALHAGWHSPVRATFNGKPYLVSAGELGACPGAWPRITSIADETNPVRVSEFRLAINRKENCPVWTPAEEASGGLVARPGFVASHFQDVDDHDHTQLGLFPFIYAGLRIADLRDPPNPREIAYFKPGDPCMSHVHYNPQNGQIWFACNASGFYVVSLKPALRKQLGLARLSTRP